MKINKTNKFCFIVGLWIFILSGIVYAATSYKVAPGQTVTVTPAGGGNDYTVKNNSTKTYFIPNKTSGEWNAFLTACNGRLSGDLMCTVVVVPPPPPPPPPSCIWMGDCDGGPFGPPPDTSCCSAMPSCSDPAFPIRNCDCSYQVSDGVPPDPDRYLCRVSCCS